MIGAPTAIDCIARLKQPTPLTLDEIQAFPEVDPKIPFDRTHSLQAVIQRLKRAAFHSREEVCPLSSNGARKVIDTETGAVLFYAKSGSLHENFGVPRGGAVEREHLYYLLDHKGFAGVLPTFRVQYRSFTWYKENCWHWWKTEKHAENKVALRKCTLHQIRTVNLDPTSPNILVPQEDRNHPFPIDGGYSLPQDLSEKKHDFTVAEDSPALIEKPFLDEPFTPEEIAYVERIDLKEDQKLVDTHLKWLDSKPPVLKIFTAAICTLKIAVEQCKKASPQAVQITLHDLCALRMYYARNQGCNNTCLLEQIASESDKENMLRRTEALFQEILKIKQTVIDNGNAPNEPLALRLLNTLPQNNFALLNLAAIYALGVKKFYQISRESNCELSKRLRQIH